MSCGPAGDWSAGCYSRFEDARSRPARDLLAAIPGPAAATAIDLGCGPGNSTDLLRARFPDAVVSGLDSSPGMIAAARKRLPDLRFSLADIATWSSSERFDVILANASLQWLPDHAALFPRLLAQLSGGGTLAVQLPDNLDEPVHVAMRRIAGDAPFADRLREPGSGRARRNPPEWYFELLSAHGAAVDVWRTTYFHRLGGIDAVVDWFRSAGLRPFLAPLDAEGRAAFLARYRDALADAYPALPDGGVLLPFPRLFIVASV